MRLVESIGGKRRHIVKNAVSSILINAVFAATVNECRSFAFHNVVLFFAHGTAHDIGSAEGIPRE